MDLYRTCPCGSGKKIKFCCKALASDLDRIKRMVDGNQRQAAVELIDRLLSQKKEKACLYSMKMTILLHAGEVEAAGPVVEDFLAHAPDNPIALAGSALVAAATPDPPEEDAPEEDGEEEENWITPQSREAIDRLQKALDACGEVLPNQVFQAIGIVAEKLMQDQLLLAAKEHLVFQASVAGKQENRAASELSEFYKSSKISLMLKQPLMLMPPPAKAAWAGDYVRIVQLCQRGQWRRSQGLLAKLGEKYPDEPTLVRSAAILHARLGENQAAVKALRRYAELEIDSESAAVMAEALAQMLDQDTYRTKSEVVIIEIPIDDAEQAMEKCLSDPKFTSISMDGYPPQGDEPPPRGGFWVLDREMPDSEASVTLDQVPRQVGNLMIFGRETDRQARAEFMGNLDSRYEETLQLLGEFLGHDKVDQAETETIGATPTIVAELHSVLHFPPHLSLTERKQLSFEHRRTSLLNTWPELPQDIFEGQSARQVCRDKNFQRVLLAAILNLEAAEQDALATEDYDLLLEQLGLPAHPPVKLVAGQIGQLPLVSLSRIDPHDLGDGDLLVAFRRATLVLASTAIRKMGQEILSRESLTGQVDKAEVYGTLATFQRSIPESIEYLVMAQSEAKKQGQSPAFYVIRELEAQLLSANVERADELMKLIQTKYIRDPGVGEMLYQILLSFGLIQPDGKPAMSTDARSESATGDSPAEVGAVAEPSSSDRIWVPGESNEPSPDADSSGSKLWVPGMD